MLTLHIRHEIKWHVTLYVISTRNAIISSLCGNNYSPEGGGCDSVALTHQSRPRSLSGFPASNQVVDGPIQTMPDSTTIGTLRDGCLHLVTGFGYPL